jgi:hypothetical protein
VSSGAGVGIIFRVQDPHGSFLANPIADLPRIDPDGQLRGQVFNDVGDRIAALPRCPVQHQVRRIRDLEAAVGRSLERLVRVPVVGELVAERGLELFAEQVDPAPGQLVVEAVEHKVPRHADFHMHRGRSE